MFEDIPWSKYAGGIVALLWGGLYISSTCAEISLVKALNYKADVWLPVYTALLVNQLWIFVLPHYLYLRYKRNQKRRVPVIDEDMQIATPRQLRIGPPVAPRRKVLTVYFIMGIITYAIALLRNVGTNSIPGSIFAFLLSTSIVFNMILSRIMLKKELNRWHMFATACALAAAGSIAAAAFAENPAQTKGKQYTVGVPAALAAGFCVALMSVCTEKYTAAWPYKRFHIAEMTVVASLIATVLLIPTLFIFKENEKWTEQLPAAANQTPARTFLIVCSVLLPVTKGLVRVAKYETITFSSALFFELVQAIAAILAAITNIIAFGEQWNWGILAAIPLMACSFALYAMAKRKTLASEKQHTPSTAEAKPPGFIRQESSVSMEEADTVVTLEGNQMTPKRI